MILEGAVRDGDSSFREKARRNVSRVIPEVVPRKRKLTSRVWAPDSVLCAVALSGPSSLAMGNMSAGQRAVWNHA